MTTKERYQGIIDYFKVAMPDVTTQLEYKTPFQLLVAVMLSAQCTDVRINKISPALFAAYPTAQEMARGTVEDIFQYVKSVSYPNSKALHLQQMANMLIEKFGGEVPSTMDELTSLPGVGRKTANVMLSIVFEKPTIAVDTHVFRVSNRIGLANGKTPLEVEKALTKNIPAELRGKAHHWILLHGRYVCKSRKPECMECAIKKYCKYYNQLSDSQK